MLDCCLNIIRGILFCVKFLKFVPLRVLIVNYRKFCKKNILTGILVCFRNADLSMQLKLSFLVMWTSNSPGPQTDLYGTFRYKRDKRPPTETN